MECNVYPVNASFYLTYLQSCLAYKGKRLAYFYYGYVTLCIEFHSIFKFIFNKILCQGNNKRGCQPRVVWGPCLGHKNTQTHSSSVRRCIFHQCSIYFLYKQKHFFLTKTEHKILYLELFLLGILTIINKYIKMISAISKFENICFIGKSERKINCLRKQLCLTTIFRKPLTSRLHLRQRFGFLHETQTPAALHASAYIATAVQKPRYFPSMSHAQASSIHAL